MSTVLENSEYMELVSRFPSIPIRNSRHLRDAIKIMKDLASRMATLKRSESDYLSVLGDLIAQYERQLPRLAPEVTPVEALKYLMKVNGLTQTDLVSIIGHKSNLSAFLNGRRELSKVAVVHLAERFKVSPTLFLPKMKNNKV